MTTPAADLLAQPKARLAKAPRKGRSTIAAKVGGVADRTLGDQPTTSLAADEQSATAAARYARSLIEASLDPLVTISPDGKITDVNEATIKVTGVPRAAS